MLHRKSKIILTNFENEDQKEESNRNENVVSSAVEEVIEEQQEQKEQQVEEKIEEEEELEQKQKEPVRTVPYNKSFKDMNNEENSFLLNRPHYIPKVRCRIKQLQSHMLDQSSRIVMEL